MEHRLADGVGKMLFDFAQPQALIGWRESSDAMLGGRSRARLVAHEAGQSALFTGSLEPGEAGGFAAVRSPALRLDLAPYTGIKLRARGDGRRYGLTLSCRKHAGILYQLHFELPPHIWTVLELPFKGLEATMLGSVLPLAPEPDLSFVTALGLMISGQEAGPFCLEVAQIAAYL